MTVSRLPKAAKRALRRVSVTTVATLTAAALLGGCGYGSQKPGSGAFPADAAGASSGRRLSAATVKIGYFANLTHGTPLIGLREGLFQKELGGTVVRTQVFNAGPSEIEALNASSIDIGWIGPSPTINGYIKSSGQALRIISGSASGGVKLVVNPAKIKTLDDVKGKRIATPQLGNTQDVAFLNWAAEKGWRIDPRSGQGDVSVVRIDNKVTPDAYGSGSVDGAWVPEPTASKLVAEGAKVLLDESSLWPDKKFVITNVIVSQTFLKNHPDVVQAVLKGSVATNAWINAHPAKAEADANAALEQLTGKALKPDVLDPAWRSIQFTDDPLAITLHTEADHAVKVGLLSSPKLDGIYDLTPLNQVLKTAGRSTVYDHTHDMH